MSSLVRVHPLRQKRTDAQKRDIAKLATPPVKFIKLLFKKDLSTNDSVGVTGFQSVTIITQQNNRTSKTLIPVWSTDQSGNAVSNGVMTFIGDEMGIGVAYLPDSPYNRRKLAVALLNNNAVWDIADPEIEQELWQRANEIKTEPYYLSKLKEVSERREQQKMLNKSLTTGTSDEMVDAELAVLSKKLKDLKTQEEIERIRAEIAEYEKKQGIYIEKPKEKVERSEDDQKIYDEAKKEVYEEKKKTIGIMKHNNPHTWSSTKEYRKHIKPEIIKKIIEKKQTEKEAINADDIRVGNEN
jgi:hypothetical protein